MKILIIFLVGIIIPRFVHAQLFGNNEEQIKKTVLQDSSFTSYEKQKLDNGNVVLVFKAPDCVYNYYLDSRGLCTLITHIYEKKLLPSFVKMNDEMPGNIKIGDLQWFNAKARIKTTIKVIEDNPYFETEFTEP